MEIIQTIKRTLIVLLLLIPVASSTAGNNNLSSQFTTQIQKSMPVDNVTELSTSYNRFYHHTTIRGCRECFLAHQWFKDGQPIFTYNIQSRFDNFFWWTLNPLPGMPGNYRVVTLVNGNIVSDQSMTYYVPTQMQRQERPTHKRLQKRQLDECEKNLQYFSELSIENPEDPYYTFMLRKWGGRCAQ